MLSTDDSFFGWLSGFIDGEGCFYVNMHRYPSFRIKLRDDDEPILREIHRRTGIGSVNARPVTAAYPPGSRDQVAWDVSRKEDVDELVRLLDLYPLRAKKARDFSVWKDAVFASRAQNWSVVAELEQALKEVRRYPDADQ